ncbi:CCR4, partial [Symbiodinium pilosum]
SSGVVFDGSLNFFSISPLMQACVIARDTRTGVDPSYLMVIAAQTSAGGALYVEQGCMVIEHSGKDAKGLTIYDNGSITAHGGALDIQGNVWSSGQMAFKGCHSDESGGAAMIRGSLTQNGGRMSFDACTAIATGGAVFVGGSLNSDGIMVFNGCQAGEEGGAVMTSGDFKHLAGRMNFISCNAAARGGAVAVYGSLFVQGIMEFSGCEAKEGGAAMVDMDITQAAKSRMSFDACAAAVKGGGAIMASGDFKQIAGRVKFTSCTAMTKGAVSTDNLVTSGFMDFDGCNAEEEGGAVMASGDFKQLNGTEAGGALYLQQGLTMISGAVTDGGGLYVHSGGLLQEGGNIKLRSSHSNEGRGGGLMIADGGLRQLAGDISCQNCSAKTGGCLAVGSRARVTAGVHLRGSIVARNCVATAGHEREWRGLAYSN